MTDDYTPLLSPQTATESTTVGATAPAFRRKWLTVALLVGINLLNYLDRFTISGILPNLKDASESHLDHDVSDSQGGLLMTVFIASYMVFSPVFGYLGDRFNRKILITVGIIFWSIFTVGGSFSQTYVQLLIARGLVGVGEASYATIAPTIIADLYPADERTFMLSVFYLAIPVGAAMGFMVGAEVAAALGSWRWALRISPPIGLALALALFFFTRDPPRGASDGHAHEDAKNSASGLEAFLDDVRGILRVPTFIWSTLGFTAVTFTSGAMAQWAPTFVYRQAHEAGSSMSSATAALAFGAVTCAAGIIGTLGGSWLSKRYAPRTGAIDSYICGVGMLLAVFFMGISIPIASYSMPLFWLTIVLGEIALCLNWAPSAAITLYVIVPQRRASAEAVNILMTHLLGDAFSPYLIGLVSDTLKKHYNMTAGDALMLSLFIAVVVALLGAAAYLRSSKTVQRDK
ncbi:hypothetical protein PTSG_06695 [Salpingoeca rosetta]|uniref:Major facilitator superfamily (MFS) profile domain-containing protein n=1 Tax=Salpingoeca rosetta (strain ATCC 50818 / BSB-021) TaxID=946362 RepID=F2UFR3_SALR5|nr:uncharacterized protein PTSG_06695 [Salpingoeca rosetta]EGD75631.1 hypothetical protein PTSG_06695 [Salpingoeca rosetta]|eukprot:XP_004992088.1 hypothetical protein PTSG_06695 [Salpingoeca rosetta]